MEDSLQNAKLARECSHKEVLLFAYMMTNESGLEFKICKKCFYRYRHLSGLTFKVCPLPEPPAGFVRINRGDI